MITVLECATLSAHIYELTEGDYFTLKIYNTNMTDFGKVATQKKSGWFRIMDLDPIMHPTNNCYAALYIKFDLNAKKAIAAVVAIRGTDPKLLDNIYVDTVSWFSDVLGNGNKALSPGLYFSKVTYFATKAEAYIRRYFPHLRLKFTGHSLGGALAQLPVLRGQFSGSVAAFNAPGVGHFSKINLFNHCFISNVNARYCAISRVGKIIGKIDVVDVAAGQETAKILFDNLDRDSFHASEVLYNFNDNIEKTAIMGNPFLALIIKLMSSTGAHHYRTSAYVRSYSSLNKSQALQNLIAQNCNSTLLTKQTACEFVTNIKGASTALLDQHRIENLVRTLGKKENARIAYRNIDHPHGAGKCFGQIGAA